MLSLKRVLVMTAVMLVVAGCGKEPNLGWDEPRAPEGPVMMENGLVYLDRAFEEIVVLRTKEGAELDVERRSTGASPEQMAMSADGKSLYVINRGDQTLSIFDIEAGSVGQSTVKLGTVYDQITVDPHGDFLLLSNTGLASDVVIQNVNEVGIVDLRGAVPDEIEVLTLPTRANNLELLPPFEMGGESQRLVAALATNNITLVDLNATERRNQVRRTPLAASQVAELEPTRVVFDAPTQDRPHRASLFVLDDKSSDVTQIVIQASLGDQDRKLELSINQLAAGTNPSEVAVLELEADDGRKVNRLLALDGSSAEFSLVDVDSGEAATFDLPMGGAASGMEVYRVPVAGESGTEKRVLVYARNSSLIAVIRPGQIAVGSDTPTLGKAVEEQRLSANVDRVVMEEGTDPSRAVVLHSGGSDGLSVINLVANENWWFQGFNPSEVIFDGKFGYGIFHNSSSLARLDLETGQARGFDLPDRGRSIYLSPDHESVLVRHSGDSGRFTVLERTSLSPENARLYEHVFLGGALDYEVSDE